MSDNSKEVHLDPSRPSMAYEKMAPVWSMIDTVLGGTRSMREAGTQYLPMHPNESATAYKERLNSSVLYNMTELTINSLVGKPFSKEITNIDKLHEKIRPIADDVDLRGNNMHQFSRHWFKEGVKKGYAHVYVDMPTLVSDEERSLRDDKENNIRPFWKLIAPEDLIFIFSEVEEGVNVIKQIRIRECERVMVPPFGETFVERIRVVTPEKWEVWEKYVIRRKVVWKIVDEGVNALGIVPLITFFTHKDEEMVCKPPLEDLAHLNVRHWQSSSDQNNILTVARFPMLAVSGAHEAFNDNVMAIGPRQLLATKAENGKFYYVEHDGKAIQAGSDDLNNLEQQMASYGAEFLRRKPGGITATSAAIDSAESTSELQDLTHRFNDTLNYAIYVTGLWLKLYGEGEAGRVVINDEFGPEGVTDVDLRSLLEARRNRDISRKAFITELIRRGLIVSNFDMTGDIKELENEVYVESPFASGRNVDGSGAANVDNEQKKFAAGKELDSGGSN